MLAIISPLKHWKALLKARAIENQAFIVACNRVGDDPNVSYAGNIMIIDYNGVVLAHQGFDATVLYATLDKNAQIEHIEKLSFLTSQDKITIHL